MSKRRLSRSLSAAALAVTGVLAGAGGAVATSDGHLTQVSGKTHCFTSVATAGTTCTGYAEVNDPYAVTISPNGKNVYVAEFEADAITIFNRATSGTLTRSGCISQDGTGGACAVVRMLDGPTDVKVSPDGKNLYATAEYGPDNGIAIFDRNTSTGALTQPAGTAGCISEQATQTCADGHGMNNALKLAISPDGKNVYLTAPASGAVDVLDRSTSDGTLTQKAADTGCIGPGTDDCSNQSGLGSAYGVTVSPDGANVYVAANASYQITDFARDGTDGTLTRKACYGWVAHGCTQAKGMEGIESIAISPDGKHLYSAANPMTPDTAQGYLAAFTRTTTADSHLGELTQLSGTDACVSADGSAEGVNGQCQVGKAVSWLYQVAVSPNDKNLYAVAYTSSSLLTFTLGSNGAPTQLTSPNGCITDTATAGCTTGHSLQATQSLAISPDGASFYTASGYGGIAEFTAPKPVAKPARPSFKKSPKSVRVSKKGAFTYRFDATKKLNGRIIVKKGKTLLAVATFTVAKSGRVHAKFTLKHKALKKLKHAKTEKTKVTVSLTNSAGTTSASTKLTLKAPK